MPFRACLSALALRESWEVIDPDGIVRAALATGVPVAVALGAAPDLEADPAPGPVGLPFSWSAKQLLEDAAGRLDEMPSADDFVRALLAAALERPDADRILGGAGLTISRVRRALAAGADAS